MVVKTAIGGTIEGLFLLRMIEFPGLTPTQKIFNTDFCFHTCCHGVYLDIRFTMRPEISKGEVSV